MVMIVDPMAGVISRKRQVSRIVNVKMDIVEIIANMVQVNLFF